LPLSLSLFVFKKKKKKKKKQKKSSYPADALMSVEKGVWKP
jgi:hypothetical protein